MKHFLKYILFQSIFIFSYVSMAQSDTTKLKRIDNEINARKSTNQLKAKSQNFKMKPSPNVDFKIEKKVNTEVILKNLNKNKATNKTSILMETLPEDRDITGKKYWKGKDVTHKKLASNMSLGTVYSTTKEVRVECRDHSAVDGDIIKIFINENPLPHSVVLKGSRFTVYLKLNEGYNRIDFQAMNQGISGPNTAELLLFDTNNNLISSKEWNLLTGQIATLGIIKK